MRIDDNAQVMIYRDNGTTWMHIAKHPGCFGGAPDAQWRRELTDPEVQELLINPYVLHEARMVSRLVDGLTPYTKEQAYGQD